jgi:hypothetical protein
MRPESRAALLAAIAKARGWVEAIRLGRFASFAAIAKREGQGERHIRLVASLALRPTPEGHSANQSPSISHAISPILVIVAFRLPRLHRDRRPCIGKQLF